MNCFSSKASGAGKTTLLTSLNFRNRGLETSGNVKINGEIIRSVRQISAISAYVQQDEAFMGTLTVREHLVFQVCLSSSSVDGPSNHVLSWIGDAQHGLGLEPRGTIPAHWPSTHRCRMLRRWSSAGVNILVFNDLKLNLKQCEHSRIGTPEQGEKGISGGERKRLAFGSEILSNPTLLFCDGTFFLPNAPSKEPFKVLSKKSHQVA